MTRPITDHLINHQRILSLSTPLRTVDGPMTVEHLVRDPHHVEDTVLGRLSSWNDPRLTWIAEKLGPDGREILIQWAHSEKLTWREAAEAAGYRAAQGEAMRRKAHYLAAEHARRQQARYDTTASTRRAR